METLKNQVTALDTEMNRLYEEYISFHREFDKFRGKKLSDDDLPEFNEILTNIQKKFQELYPVYYFIGHRHEYATNVVTEYEKFIDMIKKLGAVEADIKVK